MGECLFHIIRAKEKFKVGGFHLIAAKWMVGGSALAET